MQKLFSDIYGLKSIGDILVEDGTISKSQLDTAIKLRESGQMSAGALFDEGMISPEEMEIALELQLAEIIVALGYADEQQIFGTLRIGVVKDGEVCFPDSLLYDLEGYIS